MKNLKLYQTWLKNHNTTSPFGSRPESPEYFNFKTIWIPKFSGNRTACLDLNHQIGDFDDEGNLTGYNGNCDTPYVILEVPATWQDEKVDELAEIVAKKLNKPEDYPISRVLKADERLEFIKNAINEM